MQGSLEGQDDTKPTSSVYAALLHGNQQPHVHSLGIELTQCHDDIPSMSAGSRPDNVSAVKQELEGKSSSDLEAGGVCSPNAVGLAQTLKDDSRCAGIT